MTFTADTEEKRRLERRLWTHTGTGWLVIVLVTLLVLVGPYLVVDAVSYLIDVTDPTSTNLSDTVLVGILWRLVTSTVFLFVVGLAISLNLPQMRIGRCRRDNETLTLEGDVLTYSCRERIGREYTMAITDAMPVSGGFAVMATADLGRCHVAYDEGRCEWVVTGEGLDVHGTVYARSQELRLGSCFGDGFERAMGRYVTRGHLAQG